MVFTCGSQERLSWTLAYLFSSKSFPESPQEPQQHISRGPESPTVPQHMPAWWGEGLGGGGIERKGWGWRHEVTAGQGLPGLPAPPFTPGVSGGGGVQEQPDLRHWRRESIFKHRTVQSVRDHPLPSCGTDTLRAGRAALIVCINEETGQVFLFKGGKESCLLSSCVTS